MRRLKVCFLALSAVFSFAAVTAAPTSALPEIHLLDSEAFPVIMTGSVLGAPASTVSTQLAVLSASHIEVEITCEQLGSLCPYQVDLRGVSFFGTPCNTTGDAEGVVLLTKNEVHFVFLLLKPLVLGANFLLAKLTIPCGSLKITVEGQVIAKVLGVEDNVDVTSFEIDLKCTAPENGKQEVKEYYSDSEELVKGILKANVGLGNEAACEEVAKPLVLEANKMVRFLF